jgi:hypothetical protein
MADFDNGLPPQGTDVSDDSINSVSIATGELIESEGGRVTGVVVDKEAAGINFFTFL